MLENIYSPADLKALSPGEIPALCGEIREEIMTAVAENGGHLASNLGVVETTVALHRVFSSPRDKIVFDVGHQCYAHKILTGRREQMQTLRRFGGLSGFPSRAESEHDPFTTGHSGASLSSAIGLAEANRMAGSDAWVVAVIGDASFANGMIYEALNNCAHRGLRLMIVLNDNEMSISKNVGALSEYFAKIRLSRGYFGFKRTVKQICTHIPLLGRPLIAAAIQIKEFIKRVLNQKNIFENFGLEYLGPLDGSDEAALEAVFREAMDCDEPCVVHVVTKKGQGYLPAEENPENYHGVSPFPLHKGVEASAKVSFSSVFGDAMCALAEEDPDICAITAAMRDGTGLAAFGERFPDRFFDVGIAEEHAVTFAAGLARAGRKPVTALYSTFAQRTVDQILHDAALQKLSVTVALDRCGIVPGDGATHQGLYDIALFSPIPGVTVYAPENYGELRQMLERCVRDGGVNILRYPRGGEASYLRSVWQEREQLAVADFGEQQPTLALIGYGRHIVELLRAAEMLADEGVSVRVIRLKRIHPLPEDELMPVLTGIRRCVTAEEAMRRGGVGEAIAAWMSSLPEPIPVRILAVEGFVPHGDAAALTQMLKLDGESIAEAAKG